VQTWQWCYGSGFPKSYNIGKNTNEQWSGFGSALKPSFEPIVLARAPRQGYTYADCATLFGSGALNIDGCRIGHDEPLKLTTRNAPRYSGTVMNSGKVGGIQSIVASADQLGRFPANTMLVHHPDCSDSACVPICHVRVMCEQSGETGNGYRSNGSVTRDNSSSFGLGNYFHGERGHNDTGTSARFFYQAKAGAGERLWGLPDGVRNEHPTVKPIRLIEQLATLIKPPIADSRLFVPFCGTGSEMIGAYLAGWKHITGIEMTDEYIPIARARLQWWQRFDSYAMAESHVKNHDDKQMTLFEAMESSA
jgi:site-specific DNA-methyltransferase (adenine-specific)